MSAPTKERSSRVEVLALRATGMSYRDIVAQTGLAYSTVRCYVTDPDRAKDKARRATYAGVCEVCGAATDGSNGRGLAPTRCRDHNPAYEAQASRRGNGWRQKELLALLDDGPKRYMEISTAMGFARKTDAMVHLWRLMQYGLVVRVSRGLYARADSPIVGALRGSHGQ